MSQAYIKIPVELTNAHWQKKKGNIAKMAGETGVGKAMDDLAKAFAKIDFNKYDAGMLVQNEKNPAVIEEHRKKLVAYAQGSDVEGVRKAIRVVWNKADDAAKAFKANKLVPKSATAAAENVAKVCANYLTAVGTHGLYFDSQMKKFDEYSKRALEVMNAAKVEALKYTKSIETEAKAVLRNPTAEQYIGEATTGFFQNLRGMQASLAILMKIDPVFKKHRNNFMNISQDSAKPKDDESPEEIKKRVAEAIKYNTAAKSDLAKI